MRGDRESGERSVTRHPEPGRHRRGRHRAPRGISALIFPVLPVAALLLAFPFLPHPAARSQALAANYQIARTAAATAPADPLAPVLRQRAGQALAATHRLAAAQAAASVPSTSLQAARIPRPPKPSPVPPQAAPAPSTAATGGMGSFEQCVIERESGGNPQAYNPASGAGGLFQFLPSTWASLGFAAQYPGGAQTAPVSVQEAAFARLYAEAGTSPWAPYDGC